MVGGHQYHLAAPPDTGEPVPVDNGVDPAKYCPGFRCFRSVASVRRHSLLPGAGGEAEELDSGGDSRDLHYSGLIDSLQPVELPGRTRGRGAAPTATSVSIHTRSKYSLACI